MFIETTIGLILSEDYVTGSLRFLAAVVLIFGAVECYSGYKAQKVLRTINGGFIGVIIGIGVCLLMLQAVSSHMIAISVGVAAALFSGVLLAAVMYRFYIAGTLTFIFTAAFTFMFTLIINIINDNPNIIIGITSLLFGAAVAASAFFRLRPVMVGTTAATGALLIVNATCNFMLIQPSEHKVTSIVLWIILVATGVLCQLVTSNKQSPNLLSAIREHTELEPISFSERKYPGMQRAYRYYCTQCGHRLATGVGYCPKCGFKINE